MFLLRKTDRNSCTTEAGDIKASPTDEPETVLQETELYPEQKNETPISSPPLVAGTGQTQKVLFPKTPVTRLRGANTDGYGWSVLLQDEYSHFRKKCFLKQFQQILTVLVLVNKDLLNITIETGKPRKCPVSRMPDITSRKHS